MLLSQRRRVFSTHHLDRPTRIYLVEIPSPFSLFLRVVLRNFLYRVMRLVRLLPGLNSFIGIWRDSLTMMFFFLLDLLVVSNVSRVGHIWLSFWLKPNYQPHCSYFFVRAGTERLLRAKSVGVSAHKWVGSGDLDLQRV